MAGGREAGDARLGGTPPWLVRAAVVTWAVLGVLLVLWAAWQIVAALSLVVIPLALALFPAALLSPVAEWLKRRGLRPALAAVAVLFGFLVALAGAVTLVGWLIADELVDVVETAEESYDDVRAGLDDLVGVELPAYDDLSERVQEWAGDQEDLGGRATEAAASTAEFASGALLALVALFFFLKDGPALATWARNLFPPRLRDDVGEVAGRVWATLGAYFRGQVVVAAVDGVFIGLGLLLLGVPLAVPLAVLVFFGGFFPIVGAFTAGAVAVLVAIADGGLLLGLAVLTLNVVVQQTEGNVLEPLIVGRATRLHPLAVIVALAAGAVTLGILGAFLAVPVTASVVRGVEHLAGGRWDDAGTGRDGPDGPDDGRGGPDGPDDGRGGAGRHPGDHDGG